MHNIDSIQDLAELIKDKRKDQGLSQEDLAGIANTGARFIVDLEKAKPTCQVEKVFDVLNALGIKLGVDDGN